MSFQPKTELTPSLPLSSQERGKEGEFLVTGSLRLLILLSLLHTYSVRTTAQSLNALAVQVKGQSREFSFTNKESAFYYGETNGDNTTSWQGFNVFGQEYLDDYILMVDGRLLDRREATAVVYPDYLKRVYPNGIIEELRFADTIACFSITVISHRKAVALQIVPLVSDRMQIGDFIVGHREHALVLARKAHPKRTAAENYPVWLAVSGKEFEADHEYRTIGRRFAPFSLRFNKSRRHTIAFAVADESPVADSLAQLYLANHRRFASQRRQRMEQLLSDTRVETADKRFNNALAWAKLSLDALLMNQITKGIFAGLPWFNNYWGRDTFISLPGAALVSGRFAEAKEILRSFASFQQGDSTSTDYGRIPNLVTTTEKAYNTADGTPRFVMMAREYILRSGDSSFITEVYPVVRRSIDGTIQYHADSLGFLTHGDAETWMDAVGPDGPWSPRGNRANDIQALWMQQLQAGVWFALKTNDVASARAWQEALDKCRVSFSASFISPGNDLIFDHLRSDGTPDNRIRPNQIFTSQFLPDSTRVAVLRTVVTSLTYPYGVASLSQGDSEFHPWHQYDPYYPKDAAYHNGVVWTWVQGTVISELCRFGRQELAVRITENTVHQILDRGAVGTQSELLDAIARPGEDEPRLSGTFSQAWNLAEFVRNFYDDFLGVEVRRYEHVLLVQPRLPKSFGKVKARLNLGGKSMSVEILPAEDGANVTISSHDVPRAGTAIITLPGTAGELIRTSFRLLPKSDLKLTQRRAAVTLARNGKAHEFTHQVVSFFDGGKTLASLQFATPRLNPHLKALKGPDYPTIPHSVLKFTNPAARTLVDAEDPAMDDTGTESSRYTYPHNPLIVPGSFDITGFTVAYDTANVYFTLRFRALSNPGWHPEYGFQLTYAAIAIDVDGIPGSGQRVVPQNANFMLEERPAYERLILIGGGVQVQDSSGRILAAYIPTGPDVNNPLGSVSNATITLAIPTTYIGYPDKTWTFTVLSGGQDDHGGAGIGEFRTVNKDPGEWNGGGRMASDEPNIYDVLVAQAR